MPLPLIAVLTVAIALYNFLVTIEYILLTIEKVINWFRSRRLLVTSDRDTIAFTLREMIGKRQYGIVQGIFNTRTNRVLDARKIYSEGIDEGLATAHYSHPLVLYS